MIMNSQRLPDAQSVEFHTVMDSHALTKLSPNIISEEFESLHLCYTSVIYWKSCCSKIYSGFIEGILQKNVALVF